MGLSTMACVVHFNAKQVYLLMFSFNVSMCNLSVSFVCHRDFAVFLLGNLANCNFVNNNLFVSLLCALVLWCVFSLSAFSPRIEH